MSHAELLAAVWGSVPPGSGPEGFPRRRDWLLARVQAGERVLDLGCGEGDFAAALHGHGALPVGVEVAEEPVLRARARFGVRLDVRLVGLDEALPFADAVGTLGEIRRVVRPGGRVLLTTPDHPPELLRALADDPARFAEHFNPRTDHLRFLNAHALRVLLADLGFDVAELESDGETLFAAGSR
jgi:SAM-dependent methyltransferase